MVYSRDSHGHIFFEMNENCLKMCSERLKFTENSNLCLNCLKKKGALNLVQDHLQGLMMSL